MFSMHASIISTLETRSEARTKRKGSELVMPIFSITKATRKYTTYIKARNERDQMFDKYTQSISTIETRSEILTKRWGE